MNRNTSILDYVQEQGYSLESPCNGAHRCGKCRIKCTSEQLPINPYDRQFLSAQLLAEGYRLACAHTYHEGMLFELSKEKEGRILQDTMLLQKVASVWQDDREALGILIDLGTTTIVIKLFQLFDETVLASRLCFNKQAVYGADVITRIQYDGERSGRLHEMIMQEIKEAVVQLNREHKCLKRDVRFLMLCGNPTMTHLFLGYPVKSLGEYPFDLYEKGRVEVSYETLFQDTQLTCPVITMPHISAFVGGDIVSGIVACNLDQSEEAGLLIDLGTNGEMALGNRHHLYATSTAAGPAFEGGNISCGSPGIAGAIASFVYQDGTWHYETIHHTPANSICGSGLISFIAECLRHGLMDEDGHFTNDELEIRINEQISIHRKDISEFQLAKAAIQSGMQLLIQAAGYTTDDISHVYLSGGFGSYLKIADLITIGLLDQSLQSRVRVVYNSAFSGLTYAAFSSDLERFDTIANTCEQVNLAALPDFNDRLLDCMQFGQL